MPSDYRLLTTDYHLSKPIHPWYRKVGIAYVPGSSDPILDKIMEGLIDRFRLHGHNVRAIPDDCTDGIFTTARFGESVGWRDAPMFTARKRFGLGHNPSVYTFLYASAGQFRHELARLERALQKEPADPEDFNYAGLTPQAPEVLIEQGRRGGPLLPLLRVLQAWTKCFRVVLIVGGETSDGAGSHQLSRISHHAAYHFDLVGAHPKTEARSWEGLYDDIVIRVVTTLSVGDVTEHQVVGELVPRSVWESLSTPAQMIAAAGELGRRGFFTQALEVARLVRVPVVPGVVASQYSEGCFATWDPALEALITTVTGSTRPVHKGSICEEDLAIVVGARTDRRGALVRHVEGARNDPPSSEALELIDMDSDLPILAGVPVIRSKLHGHRGVAAYDPSKVEHAPLDPAYYHYLVSCATDAQAQGIRKAFARSEALRTPDDPRQVVFTVLPGHGVMIVEKWVPNTAPFETILEYMNAGYLQVESRVPQGPMGYVSDGEGMRVLVTE